MDTSPRVYSLWVFASMEDITSYLESPVRGKRETRPTLAKEDIHIHSHIHRLVWKHAIQLSSIQLWLMTTRIEILSNGTDVFEFLHGKDGLKLLCQDKSFEKSLQREISQLQKEFANAQETIQALENKTSTEISTLRERFAGEKSELEAEKKHLCEKERLNADMIKVLKSANIDFEAQRDQNFQLLQKNDQLSNEMKKVKEDSHQKEIEFVKLQVTHQNICKELKALEIREKTVMEEKIALHAKFQSVQTECTKSEAQINALREELERIKKHAKETREECLELRDKVTLSENWTRELEYKRANIAKELKDAQKREDDMVEGNQILHSKVIELETYNQEMKLEFEKLELKFHSISQEMETSKDKIKDLLDLNKNLQEKWEVQVQEARKQEISKLKKENEMLRLDFEKEKTVKIQHEAKDSLLNGLPFHPNSSNSFSFLGSKMNPRECPDNSVQRINTLSSEPLHSISDFMAEANNSYQFEVVMNKPKSLPNLDLVQGHDFKFPSCLANIQLSELRPVSHKYKSPPFTVIRNTPNRHTGGSADLELEKVKCKNFQSSLLCVDSQKKASKPKTSSKAYFFEILREAAEKGDYQAELSLLVEKANKKNKKTIAKIVKEVGFRFEQISYEKQETKPKKIRLN